MNRKLIKVDSKINEATLFKNGIAVIKRSISFPKSGIYYISNPPHCIHGTFWVEQNEKVEVKLTFIEKKINNSLQDITISSTDDLYGKTIIVKYNSPNGTQELKGILLKRK